MKGLIFLYCVAAVWLQAAVGLPLHTDSRWIVDEEGQRVKLRCVNWVSHLEAVVAEGLSKQPIDAISNRIESLGFNCVRLTWPLFLATNESLNSLTVRQSFQRLGLAEAIAGVQANNPFIIDLPLMKAFEVKLLKVFLDTAVNCGFDFEFGYFDRRWWGDWGMGN